MEFTYGPMHPYEAGAVCMLLEVAQTETAVELPPVNPTKLMFSVLQTASEGVVLVARLPDGRVIGSVGLHVASWYWSDARYIGDRWFFVHPEFRKSKVARTLLDATKALAKKHNLTLMLGVSTGLDTELKTQWYTRAGLTYAGGLFIFKPEGKEAGE